MYFEMWYKLLAFLSVSLFILVTSKKKHHAQNRLPKEYIQKNIEWSWDLWCHFQPKVGNCSGRTLDLYYYDTMTDKCLVFPYSGCNGNQNQFGTLQDCEQYCKGVSLNPDTRTKIASDVCSMQPNPGICIGSMSRFYYDVNKVLCEKFTYGGCGGNANQFSSKSNCLDTCFKSGA